MGEAVGLGGGAVWIRKTHNHRSCKGQEKEVDEEVDKMLEELTDKVHG